MATTRLFETWRGSPRRWLVRLMAVIAAVAVAVPAALALPDEANAGPFARVGEPFVLSDACLLESDPTPPAPGEPFHVAHGWTLDPDENAPMGQYSFALWVDGVLQESRLDVSASPVPEGPRDGGPFLGRTFVSNFPEGFTGTHTFVAVWSDADGVALDCEWDVDFGTP